MGSRDAEIRPHVNAVAQPLADVDFCGKLFKAVKKGRCARPRPHTRAHGAIVTLVADPLRV